jgi:UDP-N-acetylglucosamine transferase subunit ALG13
MVDDPNPPLVLALVGTDHHPFDRMTDWIDGWLASAPGDVRCIHQHGYSRPPRLADARPLLTYQETQALIAEAHAVVCHGGPATIMDCRRAGLMPFVVPRKHSLGEHVDNHQVLFTRRVANAGMIRLVDDEATLHRCLTEEIMKLRADTRREAVASGASDAVRAISESIHRLGPRKSRLRRKSLV